MKLLWISLFIPLAGCQFAEDADIDVEPDDIGRNALAATSAPFDTTFSLDGMTGMTFPGASNRTPGAQAIVRDPFTGNTTGIGTALNADTGATEIALSFIDPDGAYGHRNSTHGLWRTQESLVPYGYRQVRVWDADIRVGGTDGAVIVGSVGASCIEPGCATKAFVALAEGGELARFASNRLPVKVFSIGGRPTTEIAAVDAMSDGRLVIAGHACGHTGDPYDPLDCRLFVARLLRNSDFDPTFGGGKGWTILPNYTVDELARDVAVSPDGAIITASEVEWLSGTDAVVRRFSDTGDLDLGFRGGLGIDPVGFGFGARALAIQLDRKIVLGGGTNNESFDSRVFVARLHPSGAMDTSFGRSDGTADGISIVQFYSTETETLNDVAVDSRGRMVGVGWAGRNHAGSSEQLMVRLRSDGSLDPDFGGEGGKVLTAFPFATWAFGWKLWLLPGGTHIMTGGWGYHPDQSEIGRHWFTFARYRNP